MLQGKVKGYIVAGENPAVGSANGKAQRLALAKLDWLVVRDLVEIETAAFWYDSPEIESGELRPRRSRPRCSSCRPRRTSRRTARSRTRSGCCSGTTRPSSRRRTAARSSGSTTTSARSSRSSCRSSQDPQRPAAPGPDVGVPDERRRSRSRAPRPCSPRSTAGTTRGSRSPATRSCKADGSTTCGCWIYCGVFADGENQAARRKPHWEQSYTRARMGVVVAREPAPALQPRLRRSRTASRGPSASSSSGGTAEQGEVDRHDTPDFDEEKPPDYVPPDDATRPRRDRRRPPVHHAGRRARLALRPAGTRGRPAADALRAARVAVREPALRPAREPARQHEDLAGGSVQPGPGSAESYPYVAHDLPPDRAPHRRRHDPVHRPTWRSCSRRCSSRCTRSSRASAASSTAAGRRSRPRARRSRRA